MHVQLYIYSVKIIKKLVAHAFENYYQTTDIAGFPNAKVDRLCSANCYNWSENG